MIQSIVEFRASTPKDKQDAYLLALRPTAAIAYVPHATVPLLFQFARYERFTSHACDDGERAVGQHAHSSRRVHHPRDPIEVDR